MILRVLILTSIAAWCGFCKFCLLIVWFVINYSVVKWSWLEIAFTLNILVSTFRFQANLCTGTIQFISELLVFIHLSVNTKLLDVAHGYWGREQFGGTNQYTISQTNKVLRIQLNRLRCYLLNIQRVSGSLQN